MDDETVADETLSLMMSSLEQEEECRPLTTDTTGIADSTIRNSKRNPIGQVSITIAIIIVIILFAVVGIIISYSQQENIIKVVIRNHPTIWGKTKTTGSNNSSAPDGVTIYSTSHNGASMHRPNGMNSTNKNLPSSVKQPSNDGTSVHPPPPPSTSTSPRSNNPPPMNDDYAFLPWDVTTGTGTTTNRDKGEHSQPLSQLHSIKMIYQYYTMHSVGTLISQDVMTNRTYSLAFLPCININTITDKSVEMEEENDVDEALDNYYTSEILHNFFNTLVWSIITNRTLIVQWYDPTTTNSNNNIRPPPLYHIHLKNTTEQFYTCSMVNRNPTSSSSSSSSSSSTSLLSLTSWMVQWSDLLQYHPDIVHETIVPIPIDLYRQQYDTIHSVVLFPQINQFHIHASLSNKNNDAIFYTPWYHHPLSYTSGIQYVKNLPEWNRHVALELYYEGSDFLYGALFRICFPHYKYFDLLTNSNDNNMNPPSSNRGKKQSNDVVSFALFSVPHSSDESNTSQHNDVDDANINTKVNVDAEIKCLRQVLPLSDDPSTCEIVILAKNTKVIDHISHWIASSKRQCTVLRHSWNQSTTLLSSPTSDTVDENDQTNVNANADDDDGNDDESDDGDGDDDGGGNDDDQKSNEENDDNDADDDDHGSRKRKSIRKRHRLRQISGSPNKRETTTGNVPSSSSHIRLSDIAWTSNIVRTGMIGNTDHPDFQLLVEWIAYHRQIEYVPRNDDNNKYDRQRRRRFPSVATSAVEDSDAIEPLLWCEF